MSEDRQNTDLGKVIAVSGSTYQVELIRGEACGACSLKGLCFKKDEPTVFELESELDFKVGDVVSLEIAPAARVASALLIFGLPLLLLLVVFLLVRPHFSEIVSIGISFAAMAFSLVIIRWVDKRYGNRLKVEIGEVHDYPHE
ncbi:MAG TPA: SoxR reducing system RseC family protein [Candidatus Cloacimonadota bacterium]|nr:SoxR reducing system RseC family protein [Candidatus Cloacimonadota bacterium]